MRYLTEHYGAKPQLARAILSTTAPKPRNVTATASERAQLLAAAPLNVRLWLLLCSDMGIRSGTASRLGPQHYDPDNGVMTFTTKYQNAQRMQVTEEIRSLLKLALGDPDLPFVSQMPIGKGRYVRQCYNGKSLGNKFADLRRECGITRKLTPHDLRRTTARAVYRISGDMRVAQAFLGHSNLGSTVVYLQDDLVHVDLSVLELAKLNPTTEAIQ
ncbi:MAG TPA: site-specific integrase [Acidobacteriaceae bacterium]|nr:site-specific integrase [Acidobacteriaceae bacterium]